MANRGEHYEQAFEAFLRVRRIPYVAVDERKRALFAGANLKSFDFVVYSPQGRNLLVDIKGRRACGVAAGKTLQNWATRRDIQDMLQWQQVFGPGFQAVLMFLYWIETPLFPSPAMFEFEQRWYQMLGVDLSGYREHMRCRSQRWQTVCLPSQTFRQLARPAEQWL